MASTHISCQTTESGLSCLIPGSWRTLTCTWAENHQSSWSPWPPLPHRTSHKQPGESSLHRIAHCLLPGSQDKDQHLPGWPLPPGAARLLQAWASLLPGSPSAFGDPVLLLQDDTHAVPSSWSTSPHSYLSPRGSAVSCLLLRSAHPAVLLIPLPDPASCNYSAICVILFHFWFCLFNCGFHL